MGLFVHLCKRYLLKAVESLWHESEGSAILEFAIAVPLLVVFVVGIYDFGGAFNQKQKIAQAAQESAIVAGAQPTNDIETSNSNPNSLQPVVAAAINSLAGSGVLTPGACTAPGTVAQTSNLSWTYTIAACSSIYPSSNLTVTINRGWVCSSGTPCTSAPPYAVGTTVTVSFPYNWRFNSVIQLLFPGTSSYAATTSLIESATVHNQM
jgi:Flp pilus assembly protein TadG